MVTQQLLTSPSSFSHHLYPALLLFHQKRVLEGSSYAM